MVLLLLAQRVNAANRPLVMLTMSRDDSLFVEAYPDNADFDQDGVIEISYRDAHGSCAARALRWSACGRRPSAHRTRMRTSSS
jgi:hypothetical protein